MASNSGASRHHCCNTSAPSSINLQAADAPLVYNVSTLLQLLLLLPMLLLKSWPAEPACRRQTAHRLHDRPPAPARAIHSQHSSQTRMDPHLHDCRAGMLAHSCTLAPLHDNVPMHDLTVLQHVLCSFRLLNMLQASAPGHLMCRRSQLLQRSWPGW